MFKNDLNNYEKIISIFFDFSFELLNNENETFNLYGSQIINLLIFPDIIFKKFIDQYYINFCDLILNKNFKNEIIKLLNPLFIRLSKSNLINEEFILKFWNKIIHLNNEIYFNFFFNLLNYFSNDFKYLFLLEQLILIENINIQLKIIQSFFNNKIIDNSDNEIIIFIFDFLWNKIKENNLIIWEFLNYYFKNSDYDT